MSPTHCSGRPPKAIRRQVACGAIQAALSLSLSLEHDPFVRPSTPLHPFFVHCHCLTFFISCWLYSVHNRSFGGFEDSAALLALVWLLLSTVAHKGNYRGTHYISFGEELYQDRIDLKQASTFRQAFITVQPKRALKERKGKKPVTTTR